MQSEFEARNKEMSSKMSEDLDLKELSQKWIVDSAKYEYTYHYKWLGRPIIQFPQDIMALQEIIWTVKPRIIIETGIAHGGSLVFYASMLELLGGDGLVVGIDIDLREHNRTAIEEHSFAKRIKMITGSSTDLKVLDQVKSLIVDRAPVVVVLDSNHTHDHVAQELELYSTLVTAGSYLIVLDTGIEDMPADSFPNRPWSKGNNPKTAVIDFLSKTDRFSVDKDIEDKLLISVAPHGYLKCLR